MNRLAKLFEKKSFVPLFLLEWFIMPSQMKLKLIRIIFLASILSDAGLYGVGQVTVRGRGQLLELACLLPGKRPHQWISGSSKL